MTAMPVYGAPDNTGGGGGDNEQFYQAVTEMVSSNWDDSFFESATISVGDNVLDIDGSPVYLGSKVELINGELMLPAQLFEALGAEVTSDYIGVTVERKGTNIEITYGNKSIKVNGNKKGMPAEAALKNGTPVLPASVLGGLGLGFEIVFDEVAGEVTITNEFQMARLITKVDSGSIPLDVGAAQTAAGPDGLYVLQFENELEAKAACDLLNEASGVVYAEPDVLVALGTDALEEEEEAIEEEEGEPEEAIVEEEEAIEPDEAAVDVDIIEPLAVYSHLGWGPSRIGSDLYLDYLFSFGKQNTAVTVAVLDTGLTAAHPIFNGRNIAGRNFINTSLAPTDAHGHGTHVSGTVLDVAAALPNVRIMPVKVLGDDGKGSSVTVSNGIRWAADNGARVINMSLGGGHSQSNDDAVNYAVGKNVVVVVAAGNETDDAKNHCPAHIDAAITVSAFDSSGRPASFTNFGECCDVAAPGVSIVSAMPGGGLGSMSGTSMASPHVAGVAALLLCDNPNLSAPAAKALIKQYVDPISIAGNNTYYGRGICNIGKAAGVASHQFISPAPGNVTENVYSGAKTRQLRIDYYNNGSISNVTSQTMFLSGNANIATVSSSGLVTIRAAGATNITASYNGITTTIPVVGESVAPLTILSSVPANGAAGVRVDTTIAVAFSHRLTNAVTFTLRDPSGRNISWTSQTVGTTATITLSERLQPLTEYTFTIPVGGAQYSHGSNLQAYTMKFTTGDGAGIPILVTSVSLPSSASLNAGATTTLTATVLPSNATNRTLTWSSSNNNVATVSAAGVVTGVAAGTAVITARSNDGSNRSATCNVSVTIPPTAVTVSPGAATLDPNQTRQLTAALTPSNATSAITWSSSNTAVATVSAAGLVTARAVGSAVITARTANGLTSTCAITVPDTIPPVITLTGGTTYSIYRGQSFTEPGYRAIDNADGDITDKVVVTGSVDPETIGVYKLTYTCADLAGNTASATRTVSVLANSATFAFNNNKGKAGSSFNHSFTARFPGKATITATGVDSKTQATLTIRDSAGNTVFSGSFNSTAAKTVDLAAGAYTATIRIDSANGNTTVGMNIVLVESQQSGPPAPSAPTVKLIGSSAIVLHLGGSAYFEQGVTATDWSGADLSSRAVIVSNVDTSKAGNYEVKYSVTNDAGLTASVTRAVRVIAPETRTVPGRSYSFAPKGKQGESFTYTAAADVAGNMNLSVTVPNKTTATVRITNAAGATVLQETFSANATRSFAAAAGSYTVRVTIDETNGNSTLNLGFTAPGGTESYFPLPEVTR